MSYICLSCSRRFTSPRGLSSHHVQDPFCRERHFNHHLSHTNSFLEDGYSIFDDDQFFNEDLVPSNEQHLQSQSTHQITTHPSPNAEPNLPQSTGPASSPSFPCGGGADDEDDLYDSNIHYDDDDDDEVDQDHHPSHIDPSDIPLPPTLNRGSDHLQGIFSDADSNTLLYELPAHRTPLPRFDIAIHEITEQHIDPYCDDSLDDESLPEDDRRIGMALAESAILEEVEERFGEDAELYNMIDLDTTEEDNAPIFESLHQQMSIPYDPANPQPGTYLGEDKESIQKMMQSDPVIAMDNVIMSHTEGQFSNEEKIVIELMHFCSKYPGIPLNFLDGFLKLQREAHGRHGHPLKNIHLPHRETVMKKLKLTYPGLLPLSKRVQLETVLYHLRQKDIDKKNKRKKQSHRPNKTEQKTQLIRDNRVRDEMTVYYFVFRCGFIGLLQDIRLWIDPTKLNVNYDPSNPSKAFGIYTPRPGFIDDVQDALFYLETCKQFNIDPDLGEFLFCILMYVDKTGTDPNCRFAVEPFSFTLSIFKRSLRNLSIAWRVLGYLPDLDLTSSSATKKRAYSIAPGMNARNYHKILSIVLETFNNEQKKTFNPVMLRIGKYCKPVNARLAVAGVLNDGKSREMLTCKKHTVKGDDKRISGTCDCPFQESDNPNYNCNVTDSKLIDEKILTIMDHNVDEETRKAASQWLLDNGCHHCRNAFVCTDFGKYQKGITEASPIDLMHAFLEGILKLAVRIFFSLCDPVDLSNLDNMVDTMFSHLRQNEIATSGIRVNYRRGFTQLTMVTADEWAGLALVTLILLQTERGYKIIDEIYEKRTTAKTPTTTSRRKKKQKTRMLTRRRRMGRIECKPSKVNDTKKTRK